jgi:hypothetical protein
VNPPTHLLNGAVQPLVNEFLETPPPLSGSPSNGTDTFKASGAEFTIMQA